jgi:hypothetical protein
MTLRSWQSKGLAVYSGGTRVLTLDSFRTNEPIQGTKIEATVSGSKFKNNSGSFLPQPLCMRTSPTLERHAP